MSASCLLCSKHNISLSQLVQFCFQIQITCYYDLSSIIVFYPSFFSLFHPPIPSLSPSLVFLSTIHSKKDTVALTYLLSHILLLHPGNDHAREEYLKLLPKVLLGSAEDSEYLYQCRQLLSLALVHPAFPHQDREKLTYWLSRLDDKCRTIGEKLGNGVSSSYRSATLPIQTHHGTNSLYNTVSPPRRIHQSRMESNDDLFVQHRNGPNRIYINVPQQTNQIGSLNEFEALGEIDTHLLFDDEEELAPKGFTFSNHVIEQHCSTPNGYDDYIKRAKNRSLSLPTRAQSACSLPATLDDKPAPIFWKPGMKGEDHAMHACTCTPLPPVLFCPQFLCHCHYMYSISMLRMQLVVCMPHYNDGHVFVCFVCIF